MFGSMLGGIKSHHFGRKIALMIAQVAALSGLLFIRFAGSIPMFYIGNFLGGYVAGLNTALIPAYTGEINQPRIRKFTGSFIVLSFTLGFSGTYLIGKFLSWRTTVSLVMVWPCTAFVLLFFCPESPTWHMLKGRKELATEILISLRGNGDVATKEIARIEQNIQKQNETNSEDRNSPNLKNQFQLITRGTFLRPCFVVAVLMAVNWQWTGMPVLTFYTVDILKTFQIPIDPFWVAPAMGCYQFLCSLLGVFISSIIPRRKYYMGSGVLVLLGSVILATSVHLRGYTFFVDLLIDYPTFKWSPVIGLSMYLLGYQLGFISVCFMLLGELLPSNARGIGGCIIVQVNNISFFIAVKSAPVLQESMGLDGMFFLFSCVSVFAIIFAYLFVPETFGKSLEEMEEHYRKICYPDKLNDRTSKTEAINKSYEPEYDCRHYM